MVIDNGIANSTGSDFRSLPVLLLLKLELCCLFAFSGCAFLLPENKGENKSYSGTCKEKLPAERHREIQRRCLEPYSDKFAACVLEKQGRSKAHQRAHEDKVL